MVIGAPMAAVVARPSSIAVLSRQRQGARSRWVFSPLAFSTSPASSTRKLVLYSKPGCCLCDGLKEKLQAAFLLSGPDSLHDVDLQVRDITTNSEWEKAYQYEIPVLAKVLSNGTERKLVSPTTKEDVNIVTRNAGKTLLREALPRLSPRIGVELIQKKIAAALRQ